MKSSATAKKVSVLIFSIFLAAVLALPAHSGTTIYWFETGSMNDFRQGHSATLLQDGTVLIVGGSGLSTLSSTDAYNIDNGTWTAKAALNHGRSEHTSTLLQDGRVLVSGGNDGMDTIDSAELYDPATGVWTETGSMTTPRRNHTATLLYNGKVLVVGGFSGSVLLASCELYDPATGLWTATANPLNNARMNHTATLLQSGNVAVAGGSGSGALNIVETYKPTADTWTVLGTMAESRFTHTATLLPNHRLLITGGRGSGGVYLKSAEIFNPDNGTSYTTDNMSNPKTGHTATLLPNGKVLVTGGGNSVSPVLSSAQVYDPDSGAWVEYPMLYACSWHTATLLPGGTVLLAGGFGGAGSSTNRAALYRASPAPYSVWSAASAFSDTRYGHTATLLPNGRVLAALGRYADIPTARADLYNPDNNTWTATDNATTARTRHAATGLLDGRVLIAGGYTFSTVWLTGAEIYNPDSGSWSAAGSLATGVRMLHTLTLLRDGRVLLAGGRGPVGADDSLHTAELYSPATGLWNALDNMTSARFQHTATLLHNGTVLVAGGNNSAASLDTAELFDPAEGLWASATGNMATARESHTATLLPDGRVLVAGGKDYMSNTSLAGAEIYDPASGLWSAASPMNTARTDHVATLLSDGRVLVTGGYILPASTYLSIAEIYAPATNTWTQEPSMNTARRYHTATLMSNGKVLVAGGQSASSTYTAFVQLYDRSPDIVSWKPIIYTITDPLLAGMPLELTGNKFMGISQASSGATTQDSATNYPLVQLQRIAGDQMQWLLPDPAQPFSDSEFTALGSKDFPPGPALVTVFTNGIASLSEIILIEPSAILEIIKAGTGSGTVSSNPAAISCGASCWYPFLPGAGVTLTASPAGNSTFIGWSGGGCSGTDNCSLVMNDAQSITAAFNLTTSTSTSTVAPTTTTAASSTTTVAPATTTTAASTTTSSIKPKCPLIKATGSERSGILNIFRKFRDSRLASTETGRSLINLYYSHSPEISQMLAASDGLNNQVRSLMFRLAPPLFMSMYRGMALSLTGPQYSQILDLVMELKTTASPGLASGLEMFLTRLADGSLQQELGFNIR